MNCKQIQIGGATAIICGRHKVYYCQCGKASGYQCDWKTGRGTTCDRHICDTHAQEVGENKHLCPEHQRAYLDWRVRKEGERL